MPANYSNAANFARILVYWVSLVAVITFLSGLVYISLQQVLRHSANDPQIQMAEDAAVSLSEGKNLQAVLPASIINMASSLAPYLIIFDDTGQPVASSVQLDGKTPVVPPGVFSYVRQQGEDRLTWQPKTGVRSAAVVTHYGGSKPGFVLAGRSLREVEKRDDQLLQIVGFAWLTALLASTILAAGIYFASTKFIRGRAMA